MSEKQQEHSYSPVRPLLAGDSVGGRRVEGFAWAGRNGESTHLDDRLLLAGDEILLEPPDRSVPQTADGADPTGVIPPEDLPDRQLRPAASIDPTLRARAVALLNLEPWQPLMTSLLAAVNGAGHRIWLAGGAVRDLVAGASVDKVNDMDLSGTVPPGRFTDLAYQCLRAAQMSECRTTISPDSLVCAVTPPGSRDRLIEYRGLNRAGFRFPVVGSGLAEDARHRDFSFNALLYDALDHIVLDTSGSGLADLLGAELRFSPQCVSTDPMTQAFIVVRAAKFAVRWRDKDLDLEPLHDWIARLSRDLCRDFTDEEWTKLGKAYRKTVVGPEQAQLEFAADLPEPGRELIEKLIGRAG
ncbi:MAG: hypothetical protein ABW215_13390 [Kibdelosporangium sp.]